MTAGRVPCRLSNEDDVSRRVSQFMLINAAGTSDCSASAQKGMMEGIITETPPIE